MPYSREYASKDSHIDIVRNPDIDAFLANCDYLRPPTDEVGKVIAAAYQVPPPITGVPLPAAVIAVDGSFYEGSIHDRFPSTRVGYVKISSVLIDMHVFESLRVRDGGYVDPFRVAEIHDNSDPVSFALPSANVKWQGFGSVRDSFRAAVDEQLYSEKTRFRKGDPQTSLRTTLFELASRRPGDMGTGNRNELILHKCPYECGRTHITVRDIPDDQFCPACHGRVFPSDCLRFWEEVSEFQSNGTSLGRFMLSVEHMMPVHYVRQFLENGSLTSLSDIALFVDGPLAVFGTSAWLHAAIMKFYHEVNERLVSKQLQKLIVIGLQKTGQVVDHVKAVERYLPPNRLYAIDDDYRYSFILAGRDPSMNGFGAETYYGQDFIFKTPSGRCFVFGLPYPFSSKAVQDFVDVKVDTNLYPELSRVIQLIEHFEIDLYENAVIPIALAHRHAAISLVPGGQVLDLLTRRALGA